MKVSEFDFDLPEARIALRPMVPREAARLLVMDPSGDINHKLIADLESFVREGDLFVINNTKVLATQLSGVRVRDGIKAQIEATLIKPAKDGLWQAFIKPGKKVKDGDILQFYNRNDINEALDAKAVNRDDDGVFYLSFNIDFIDILHKLERIGEPPLPPYIRSKRDTDTQDKTDYQTVFAKHDGSVAAPTAGLHLTTELMEKLKVNGAEFLPITLHVGAGTFLPMKVDDTEHHKMHAEWGEISESAADIINLARKDNRRIIAVGTTALRLLESAFENGKIRPFLGETDIFITPGRAVQSADYLLTNFHLPKSTLFMLVCAFSGMDAMKSAYGEAIRREYRFFSYGDACLLPNLSRS